MSRAGRLLGASLLAIFSAAPGAAGPIDNVLARPVLMVESGKDAGTELALKRNGEVTSARVLPGRVVMLDADVTAGGQVTILRKGDILALFRITQGQIFCATRAANPKDFVAKIPCLFDSDGDGKFDSTMRVGIVQGAGMYRSAVIVRDDPKAVTPVTATPVDAADYPLFTPVRIVFTGGGSDNASFVVMLGDRTTINGTQVRGKGSFPFDVEVLGARLTILGYEKGVTRLRITRPVPGQPFLLSNGLM